MIAYNCIHRCPPMKWLVIVIYVIHHVCWANHVLHFSLAACFVKFGCCWSMHSHVLVESKRKHVIVIHIHIYIKTVRRLPCVNNWTIFYFLFFWQFIFSFFLSLSFFFFFPFFSFVKNLCIAQNLLLVLL